MWLRIPQPRLWRWAPLPWVGYAVAVSFAGHMRFEHAIFAGVVILLCYRSEATRRFFVAAAPLLVLFLLYDSMRYWEHVGLTPARVLGCGLHDAELTAFGVPYRGQLITLNELFAIHHAPSVDLIAALPYGTYLFAMAGIWIVLYKVDLTAARRFAWLALGTHVLGFITYHAMPAAPPWYVAARGCAIDLNTKPYAGAALERVDAMLHTNYFQGLYSRGSAVFGALPSLHAAYPFFGLLATAGRVKRRWTVILAAYALLMAFAAVYLDHHYVIDVLLGVAYVLIVFAIVRRVVGEVEEVETS